MYMGKHIDRVYRLHGAEPVFRDSRLNDVPVLSNVGAALNCQRVQSLNGHLAGGS